jgi:hypothetical protein
MHFSYLHYIISLPHPPRFDHSHILWTVGPTNFEAVYCNTQHYWTPFLSDKIGTSVFKQTLWSEPSHEALSEGVCLFACFMKPYMNCWQFFQMESVRCQDKFLIKLQIWIILCEISGSHGGKYEDDSLLGLVPCSLVAVDRRFRGTYCLHHYVMTETIRIFLPITTSADLWLL